MSDVKPVSELQGHNPEVNNRDIVSSRSTDVAYNFLATHDLVSYTAEEDKKVRLRIDLHILPLVRISLTVL